MGVNVWAKVSGWLRTPGALKMFGYRVVLAFCGLALWEFVSGRYVDPFWISRPSEILIYLAQITWNGVLIGHMAVTLQEAILGYVIGAFLGIGTGFVFFRMRTLAQILDPFMVAAYGIPRIALAPLFILWFGIGLLSKIILVVSIVFFITFFNTFSGLRGVSQELINIALVMGANRRQILWKVTLPATYPWILGGLKISVPFALVGAIVGEFIAASKGLGFWIQQETALFNTTAAMAGIFVLMAIVIVANSLVIRLENHLLRWRPNSQKDDATLEEEDEKVWEP